MSYRSNIWCPTAESIGSQMAFYEHAVPKSRPRSRLLFTLSINGCIRPSGSGPLPHPPLEEFSGKQLANTVHVFPWLSDEDTLLNVFLAIAVDNLANAQELTAAEEEAEQEEAKVRPWPLTSLPCKWSLRVAHSILFCNDETLCT